VAHSHANHVPAVDPLQWTNRRQLQVPRRGLIWTEAGPEEMVYLPPGAHYKIELIGEKHVKLMLI
jgi:hypothetical protein